MDRTNLLEALSHYRCLWPAERNTIERFTRFVSENPNCFERSLAQGHITASAWIVHQSKPQILLTHHRKLASWFQLGGHADGESDTLKVATKEAIEESGLPVFQALSEEIFDIDIHLIPARKSEPDHYHYDVRYLLQPAGSGELVVSEESLDLKWVELADLESYTTEPSMLRMAAKWKQFRSKSLDLESS